VNLGTLRRPGSFCGPSQNVYYGEKKFRKFTEVSEKMGVKDFSLGAISLSTGEKLSKSKSKSTTCPWLDNVNFPKKFSYLLRFCALLTTSLILGGVQEPKIGPFVLNFSLNVMSKFRVPEMTVRGNSDTVKNISRR